MHKTIHLLGQLRIFSGVQLSLQFFHSSHSTYHTAPYIVDLIVGGLSPKFHVTSLFFTFFWQTGALRFLRTSTPWASLAMASLLPATTGRRPFRGTALVAHIMGDSHPLGSIKFIEGGEIYITIHQGDLRGLSLPQHGATL
jgi:hypothetical protein